MKCRCDFDFNELATYCIGLVKHLMQLYDKDLNLYEGTIEATPLTTMLDIIYGLNIHPILNDTDEIKLFGMVRNSIIERLTQLEFSKELTDKVRLQVHTLGNMIE